MSTIRVIVVLIVGCMVTRLTYSVLLGLIAGGIVGWLLSKD
jgi:uncharacterized transporter YbjL